MDTLSVFETRRSCKAYLPRMVEKEKLEKIIRAGTYAATGRGKQSPIILAVTNQQVRNQLSAMNAKIMGQPSTFDPFYGAPVVLVVLADKTMPTYLYDGSLVMGNMMNAAEALGVNSCWIHRAKEEFEMEEGKQILKSLGIEGDYEGIGNLVLGYAATPLKPAAPRKENYVYYVK
jgi:nitroreductase